MSYMSEDMKVIRETRFPPEKQFFPILYEKGPIRIYKNHTDEIFIENTETRTTMRISKYPHGDGGIQFTTGGALVEPIKVNGMIGWRVGPR